MKPTIQALLATLVISAVFPIVSYAGSTTSPAPALPGTGGPSGERATQMMERFQQMRQQEQEKFKNADKDGNGSLSKEEAQQGMPQLAKNFDQIDVNHDGQISTDEIRQYYQSHMAGMRERMQQQHPAQPSPAN